MSEVPEPLDVTDVLEELQTALQLFGVAFGQGPVDVTKAVSLWQMTQDLRIHCAQFDEFLTRYEKILRGLIWAHYPTEYRKQVYPVLRDRSNSKSFEQIREETATHRPRKTMIEVVEEIFVSRQNVPISVQELVPELESRGIRFRARNPDKSLAQAMRASGKFHSVSRGLYQLKTVQETSLELL